MNDALVFKFLACHNSTYLIFRQNIYPSSHEEGSDIFFSDWEGKGPCANCPLRLKISAFDLIFFYEILKNGPLEILNFLKNAANGPLSKFYSTTLLFMCLVFTGRLVCRDWEGENDPLLLLCRFLLCLENCTTNTATLTMEADDFFQRKNIEYMPRTQQLTFYTKCIQNAKF